MACRVGFVVYDGVGLLDVVGPSDVFTTANQVAGAPLYHCVVTAVGCAEVRAESGLRLGVDVDLAGEPEPFDLLMVAGGLGFREALTNRRLMQAIAGAADRADRVTSVCTGAFLLAAIGQLDQRRATTHWAYAAELAEAFPKVSVVSDEIYVRAGSVTTAAGVVAGIDLALAIVEADHGAELARSVSRRLVVYLHRAGGQSQFSERFPQASEDDSQSSSPIDTVLAQLVQRPGEQWSVERMAATVAMSRRHFARVFKAHTGTTPARWVERVRVEEARTLLHQTKDPVSRIAQRAGFASAHTMGQAFQRVVGLSPTHYRAMHAND